jgi:hypothetical protein
MEGSKTGVIVEYQVDPVQKQSGESEVHAIERLVRGRAEKGFELLEACGDEIRMPNLIFAKTGTDQKAPELKVEEIAHVKGKGEIDEVRERLLELNDQGWFPLCVLDSPLVPPIAIYKKVDQSPAIQRIEVIPLEISLIGQMAKSIKDEIFTQQISNKIQLRTVMASGLTPVLIFLSKKEKGTDDFLVEHAKGGVFSNASKKLSELIKQRSLEGWQVCGAFEDQMLMPCVVFRRPADDTTNGE